MDEGYEASIESDGSVHHSRYLKSCHLWPEAEDDSLYAGPSSIELDPTAWSSPPPPTAWEEAQRAEEARRARQLRVLSWLEEEDFPGFQSAPGVFVPWESRHHRRERLARLVSYIDQLVHRRRTSPRLIIGAMPCQETDTTILGTLLTRFAGVTSSLGSGFRPSSTATSSAVIDSPGKLQRARVFKPLTAYESRLFVSGIGLGINYPVGRVVSKTSIHGPARRPYPSDSQSEEPSNIRPRKRTKLVHTLAGGSNRMGDGNATGNSLATTADPNELAPSATSPALPRENSEPGNSTYPEKHKTDPSGPLSDQDFASWRDYCWFYAHNQDRHTSDAWSSCRRPKKAISHITRHAEDVHGLSRGQGSEYTKQVYLARCAQNDPSVESNTPCDACKSVATWSTTQLADPTHEGAAVCLRCYTIFATKKELFAHLNQGFLCVSRQRKLSKQTKLKISYMAFCSATQPPSGNPPSALLFVTTQGGVAGSQAATAQPEAPFLAGIPEIARQPPLQIQTQDVMAAETSLLMGQAQLSPEAPVRASSTGASPSMAPGAHSLDPWIPLQTRFLGLGPALDQHPPAFRRDWALPDWRAAAHGSLTDEGYSTLTSSGATLPTHHLKAAQSTTWYAPPRVLTAPLTDQLEFGYGRMFNFDVFQPGYGPPGHSGMADGGLSFGSDSVDPTFAAMPWQQAPTCGFRVGTPPASAQQCSTSTNPTFGDMGTGNSSYGQPGLQ